MFNDKYGLTQAVLEGVCFGIRDSFEVAKAQGINITNTKMWI